MNIFHLTVPSSNPTKRHDHNSPSCIFKNTEKRMLTEYRSFSKNSNAPTGIQKRDDTHPFKNRQPQQPDVKEKIERAKNRRSGLESSRRSCLQKQCEERGKKSALLAERSVRKRVERARHEIRKSMAVARRVRAARIVQRSVRRRLLKVAVTPIKRIKLCHNEAAMRIQRWRELRMGVSATRFSGDLNGVKNAGKALQSILIRVGDGRSFDEMTGILLDSDIIDMARRFLDSLLPILFIPFRSVSALDPRSFLSAILIAFHPREIVGNADKPRVKLLIKSCQSLHRALCRLSKCFPTSDITKKNMSNVASLVTCFKANFYEWKKQDLDDMIRDIQVSAEQTWVAYLISTMALNYIDELCPHGNMLDDPLTKIRLYHHAAKVGSCSHLKQLRSSLNKLLRDTDRAKNIFKAKKMSAMEYVQNEAERVKREIREALFPTVPLTSPQVGSTPKDLKPTSGAPLPPSASRVISNAKLLHEILLTSPDQFHKLTWSGNPPTDPISVEEFMRDWKSDSESKSHHRKDIQDGLSSIRIREFLNKIQEDITKENFPSSQILIVELNNAIRSLIPNRRDLHTILIDDSAIQSTHDLLSLLLQAGKSLAMLESPDRSKSTLYWVETASSSNGHTSLQMPLSEFITSSAAFLFTKVEQCKQDISNSHLVRLAPFIHQIGVAYERERLQNMLEGDVGGFPITTEWLRATIQNGSEEWEVIRMKESKEYRCSVFKRRGFVDNILFRRWNGEGDEPIEIPEIFALDEHFIFETRRMAYVAVLGSALAIHASNIAGVRMEALIVSRSTTQPFDFNEERVKLRKVLEIYYDGSVGSSVGAVSEAVISLSRVLKSVGQKNDSELCDISSESKRHLSNCVTAVLDGNDPVLKLLNNRIRQFFRSTCKRQPPSTGGGAPVSMRTGRASGTSGHGANSNGTKDRVAAARKEACKLGFWLFADDLARASVVSQKVFELGWKVGEGILDRFVVDICCSILDKRDRT